MDHPRRIITSWAYPILIGLIIGLIAAVVSLFFMLNSRKTVLTASLSATRAAIATRPIATDTPIYTPTPIHSPTPAASPTPEFDLDAALNDAGEDIDNYDFEKARDSLLPLLEVVTDSNDLSRINTLIGDTYLGEDQSRMGNYYYEQAYNQQATAENLYKLAITYSATGQHEKALEKFEALLAYPGGESDEYLEDAQKQLEWLRTYLGTTTPAP